MITKMTAFSINFQLVFIEFNTNLTNDFECTYVFYTHTDYRIYSCIKRQFLTEF